jgi:hypothetical protein
LDASDKDKKRAVARRKRVVQASPAEPSTPTGLTQSSITAQLMAVSFGGQVLGRRIHAVSSDNWRR